MAVIRTRIERPSFDDLCESRAEILLMPGIPALSELRLSTATRERWVMGSEKYAGRIAMANMILGMPVTDVVSFEDFAEIVAVQTGRY